MGERDGYLDEATRLWIQEEADRYYSGNFGMAAAAILQAAYAAEQAPADPWAGLNVRARLRAEAGGAREQS
jgi:hypothetical protein